MNKVYISFNIYVYKQINDFKIMQIYELTRNTQVEPISGYFWKSNTNNEKHINVNDPEYFSNQYYSIIIAPNLNINMTKIYERENERKNNENPRGFNYIETVDRNAAIKFYLGVSTQNTPLMISQGMPYAFTLNKDYKG